jgi:hypothetical protein
MTNRETDTTLFARLQFRILANEELVPETKHGVAFETVTIDVPVYLPYLYARVLAKGGAVCRASVQHINQVLEGAFCSAPDGLVVCAGLGARTLGGVEDQNVYPIRGQTVLVHAPWVRFGRTSSGTDLGGVDEIWTYIIPRRSGNVGSDHLS